VTAPSAAIVPAGSEIGNSVTSPCVVMRPIRSAATSTNQSAPSGPATMPEGALSADDKGNSVMLPLVVMRPILLALTDAELAGTAWTYSVNHSAPSGPPAMPWGELAAVGSGNSVIICACATRGPPSAAIIATTTTYRFHTSGKRPPGIARSPVAHMGHLLEIYAARRRGRKHSRSTLRDGRQRLLADAVQAVTTAPRPGADCSGRPTATDRWIGTHPARARSRPRPAGSRHSGQQNPSATARWQR